MATLVGSITQSQLFNFACVPLLLLQCSLLHPAYEADPSARVIRLLLLPAIIVLAVSTQSRKLFLPLEEYLHVNYGLVAVPTFHICCLAVQFAFHRGPALKEPVSETEKHDIATTDPAKVIKSSGGSIETQSAPNTGRRKLNQLVNQKRTIKLKHDSHSNDSPAVAELIKFSIGIVASPRGLAYTWAPPTRCLSRAPRKPILQFIREHLVDIIKKHVLFLITCAYLLPAINHPEGPCGWISETFGIERSRALDVVINQLTAAVFTFSAICAFNILGGVLNGAELLFITLARLILPEDLRPEPFDTSLYPPLFNRLGSRDNLSEFWGQGWQCVFRRDFVFCGGLPMAKLGSFLFGPQSEILFALMGSMLLSGIFHEWGILTITKPDLGFNTTKFFVIQGLGIVLERKLNLRKVLGGRAMRPLRYFLTYFWLSYWSQDMFEILYDRGLGRSGIIDSDFRKWYWFQYFLPFGPFLPRGLINGIKAHNG
ncbi:hypothetical protein PGT21_030820 [Puccinia graminis f. sp. tritici]|uniref:Wax synthase domain-containing protein n=1 Tax=Puccinia graminis f. sp. tritici TaxID=56615 RepID=A0A5B0PZD9_PUCGR|nr:hypothetical protein PGT21_030820 [Puccinia graminis f. sp. tritici]KAA1109247.1 hypothetical protein PGTUg99_022848 [Puccinia graminis f. sp. tritici]